MKWFVGLLIALVAVPSIAEEKCPCDSYPFEPNPPCYPICTRNLSKSKDLSGVRGLTPEAAAAIRSISSSSNWTSIDFSKVRNEADLKAVAQEFKKPQLQPGNFDSRAVKPSLDVKDLNRDATTIKGDIRR